MVLELLLVGELELVDPSLVVQLAGLELLLDLVMRLLLLEVPLSSDLLDVALELLVDHLKPKELLFEFREALELGVELGVCGDELRILFLHALELVDQAFVRLLDVGHAVLDGQLHRLQLLVLDNLPLLVLENQLLECLVLVPEGRGLRYLIALLLHLCL